MHETDEPAPETIAVFNLRSRTLETYAYLGANKMITKPETALLARAKLCGAPE